MQATETVKLEIEVPKDQVERILASSKESSSATNELDKELDKEKRIAKFKKRLAEARDETTPPTGEDHSTAQKAKSAIKSPASVIPQTNDTSPPNPNQKKLIIFGLVLALLGLILWPLSNFLIASIIAIIGAAVVATGTFVKV